LGVPDPNVNQARVLDPGPTQPGLTGAFQRYQQAISEQQVEQILEGQSAFSRDGPLTAWVVIWLMIFQRLHPRGTLSVAVRQLLTGPVRDHVRWPDDQPGSLSANTSAYSQCRRRLPLLAAEKVSDLMFASLRAPQKTLPGLDRPLFLLDGSSILLAHTGELVQAYPPARNQHGVSHWPVLRVVTAHDVVSGLAVRPYWGPMYGPQAVSEQELAKRIIYHLPDGSVVLGDRNFGVFSMAYAASQHHHPCLFRLTEARARKLKGGVLAPASRTDKRVRWVPSREDGRNNPEIPAQACVEGRLLAFKVRDRDGPWQKLYLFTTLDLPAEEILRLYGYRWNIETDLRSLKREVRLHMLTAKSKAMVDKELLLGFAAYNLTRATMNQAASALHLDPRQLSFAQAQDTINAFLPLFAKATSESEREAVMQEMLRVFGYCKLPRRRKRRSAPRQIWPRPCSFPKRKVGKKRGTTAAKKGIA